MRLRRIVTGHDAEGRPAVVADAPLPRYVERTAVPGMTDGVVWATASPPAPAAAGEDPAEAVVSVIPGAGATHLLTVTIPPAAVFESEEFDPAAAAAEDAEVVPGLAERFDPADPGMHTTPTVDYQVVLEGELWLDLGEGRGASVGRGDIVIQNNTRHAWRNRGEVPATLLTVMVGLGERGEQG